MIKLNRQYNYFVSYVVSSNGEICAVVDNVFQIEKKIKSKDDFIMLQKAIRDNLKNAGHDKIDIAIINYKLM